MSDDETRMRQLAVLRAKFPAENIAKLPKVTCYYCTQANKAKRGTTCNDHKMAKCRECGNYITTGHIHLDYVGHAEATDRLLDADPEWTWEPLSLDPRGLPAFDEDGGMWIRLTVAGVTRLGYGSADGKRGPNAIKEVIGDAIRNAGMRFGMALDLWAKTDLHADEDEADQIAAQQDRVAEAPQDRPARRHLGPVEDEWNSAAPSATQEQREAIGGGLRAVLGIHEPVAMLAAVQDIVGRKLAGPTELTFEEADKVLASLRETERKLAAHKRQASEARMANDVKPKYASGGQLTALKEALAKKHGISERTALLAWCGAKLERSLGAMKDITESEYEQLMAELSPPGADNASLTDEIATAMRAANTSEALIELSERMWTEHEAGRLSQADVSKLQDISLKRESEITTTGKAAA